MKKVFCLLSLALLCPAAANAAEDAGDFYQNLLVTDEVIAAENEDIAIENARRMLDSKPKILKMKDNKVVRLPNRDADLIADKVRTVVKANKTRTPPTSPGRRQPNRQRRNRLSLNTALRLSVLSGGLRPKKLKIWALP